MEIENAYHEWVENVQDAKLLNELKNMNEDEKNEAFVEDISFGTGGLRGIMGAGTAKMNEITIKRVTKGFIKYLNSTSTTANKTIAITSDSRNKSKDFIDLIVTILAKNNIKSLVYSNIKPTPMLSYLVRKKGCDGGIMITASHNPKEYNGYKVYNKQGSQLSLLESEKMINAVESIPFDYNYEKTNLQEVIDNGLLEYIDDSFDEIYFSSINNVIENKKIIKNLKIVYSPLHGTGYEVVPKALKFFGFNNVVLVKEQLTPDGNFPNTSSTNPEEIKAYDLGLAYAKKNNSDLLILNDPDADRIGIMFKDKDENYSFITGNQTGALLIDYLIRRDNINSGIIYKTIVTGDLGSKIAKRKGIKVEETLTGFKFIGEKIETNKFDKFVFGYEESYGYLINDCVRDKDAIQSSLLISEMVDFYKNQNITLDVVLEKLYNEYGHVYEITKSLTFTGIEGMEKIKKVMTYYKEKDFADFSGYGVVKKNDYNKGIEDIPKSDVIKFYLDDIGWLVFRPSGTEPKLKVYFSISSKSIETSREIIELLYNDILKVIENI